LRRSRPEGGHGGAGFGVTAIETNTTITRIFAVALYAWTGRLQCPELRSGTGEMGVFFAAMPQKTHPFHSWRGAAAPHAAAKGDCKFALFAQKPHERRSPTCGMIGAAGQTGMK
jgi:hypothetical protein